MYFCQTKVLIRPLSPPCQLLLIILVKTLQQWPLCVCGCAGVSAGGWHSTWIVIRCDEERSSSRDKWKWELTGLGGCVWSARSSLLAGLIKEVLELPLETSLPAWWWPSHHGQKERWSWWEEWGEAEEGGRRRVQNNWELGRYSKDILWVIEVYFSEVDKVSVMKTKNSSLSLFWTI